MYFQSKIKMAQTVFISYITTINFSTKIVGAFENIKDAESALLVNLCKHHGFVDTLVNGNGYTTDCREQHMFVDDDAREEFKVFFDGPSQDFPYHLFKPERFDTLQDLCYTDYQGLICDIEEMKITESIGKNIKRSH